MHAQTAGAELIETNYGVERVRAGRLQMLRPAPGCSLTGPNVTSASRFYGTFTRIPHTAGGTLLAARHSQRPHELGQPRA